MKNSGRGSSTATLCNPQAVSRGVLSGACAVQIYDKIYYENFERAKKAEEARAREEAQRAQQAAWGGGPGGPPGWGGGPPPPGWEGAWQPTPLFPHHLLRQLLAVLCASGEARQRPYLGWVVFSGL